MKRFFRVVMLFCAVLFVAATAAHAGIMGETVGKAWGWIKGEAVGAIAVGVFTLLSVIGGALYYKIANTLKEGGEALTQLGNAMLSKDGGDAAKILPEVKDVFDIWRPTPERFKLGPAPIGAPNNPANPGQ